MIRSKFVLTSSVVRQSTAVRFFASKKYSKDHEWVEVKDGVATVGITDYAQQALGDVVYVEIPQIGKSVSVKDPVGAVESVKAASDVYAPISGEIVGANAELESDPVLINSSPEHEGWIAKIKVKNPKELDSLMDLAAYQAFIKK